MVHGFHPLKRNSHFFSFLAESEGTRIGDLTAIEALDANVKEARSDVLAWESSYLGKTSKGVSYSFGMVQPNNSGRYW